MSLQAELVPSTTPTPTRFPTMGGMYKLTDDSNVPPKIYPDAHEALRACDAKESNPALRYFAPDGALNPNNDAAQGFGKYLAEGIDIDCRETGGPLLKVVAVGDATYYRHQGKDFGVMYGIPQHSSLLSQNAGTNTILQP